MDIKTLFAITGSIIGIVFTIPYIIDIFRRKTEPHSYSWLVWTILQATGVLAMLASGAGIGILYLSLSTGMCALIFVLSLRFGTKNVTSFDLVCLVSALSALFVWFFMHDALLSIIMVSCIDFIGFLPTFRKAYADPFTETVSNYFSGGVAQVLSLASLSEYHLTTSLYLIALALANFIFTTMVLLRRMQLQRAELRK
ncbi:MAG: hypothetical protein Q7R93_02305 [bacterium]|nr:hypothetical protein [bacterium]